VSYVALLRGVNVGGNRIVAMADLRAAFTKMGFADATTVLQSGNVVFRSARTPPSRLEATLEAGIEKAMGVRVEFHVRSADEWKAILAANPFRAEAEKDPGRLLVTCFKAPLDAARVKALEAAIVGRERLHADGRHLYMTFPDGMGDSKAARLVDKMLAARGTARNWNTMLKLAALLS
jgi:uncharacterized protein (DUF1697 family)